MARASRSKKKGSVRVNFKNVESRRTPPEGDYKLEILEATTGTSNAGNDQIEFVLEVADGEYKGTKVWFYCPLAENSLWKLHAFLTALGEDVPEDEMDIDLSDLVGKELVGVLTHETYQGKKQAKMTDFDSIDNYKGGDDKSAKKSKKSKKDKDEPEEKEEKSSKKGKKSKKDEPEEKEEKSSKKGKDKKKGKEKKKKKYEADDIDEMDEDDLQEVIDESGIDVDLDDFKKLPKKRNAVKEALEAADLLDD